MTTLATETFTGTTGAALPSQWSSFVSGTGSSATIQANAGAFKTSTTAYTISVVAQFNTFTTANFDITFDVKFSSLNEQYFTFGARRPVATSTTNGGEGYYVQIYPGNGATSMGVNKMVGTTETALSGDLSAGAFVANTYKRIRFQGIGTALKLKVWDPAAGEPGTWLWQGTDSSITAAGRVGLTHMTGFAATSETATLDNITVTDGAAGAPTGSGTAAFSGSGSLALPGVGSGGVDPLLSNWQTALANSANSPAKIMSIGASGIEGQGASTRLNRYWDKLRVLLQTNYPSGATGGDGYLPAYYSVYGPDSPWGEWRTSSTGTTTNDTSHPTSLGYRTVIMSPGAVRTYTFTGTDLDIWYGGRAGAGAFTWKIDAGSATAVTAPTTTSANNRVQVTGLTAGSHTVTITATGTTYLEGFTVYNGDRNKGVQMFDGGHVSAETNIYSNMDSSFDAMLNTVGPDLVVLGNTVVNDAGDGLTVASAQSSLQTLINRLKALTKVPSILIIADYQPTPDYTIPWSSFVTMMQNVAATNGLAFLDMRPLIGPSTNNGADFSSDQHPNNTGHTKYANAVYSKITASTGTAYAGVPGGVGSAAFSGSGGLAATGSAPKAITTANLSGSGALAPSVKPSTTGTAALTGSGTLSSSVKPVGKATVALTGDGSLAGTGKKAGTAVDFSGNGSLIVGGAFRTNYATNPHALATPGGWTNQTPAAGITSYDATGAQDGGSAYAATTTTSGPVRLGFLRAVPNATVAAATSVTVGLDVWAPVACTGQIQLGFTVAGVAQYPGGPFTPMTPGWNRLVATIAVPAGTQSLNLSQFVSGNDATILSGQTWKATRATLELGVTDGSYFDGDTPTPGALSQTWTGAANNSTSTELTPPLPAVVTTVNLAGSGALAAGVTAGAKGGTNLTGAGALATSGALPALTNTVDLTGTGSLLAGSSVKGFGAQEWVRNPGFETNSDWTFDAIASRDTTFSRSGGASLKVLPQVGAHTTMIPVAGGGAIIPVTQGEIWEVSVWCYTTADYNGDNSNGKLRLARGDGSLIAALPWGVNDGTKGTDHPDAWAFRTIRFSVPAGITDLSASIVADHTIGTLWVDDVSFRMVSEVGVGRPIVPLTGSGTLLTVGFNGGGSAVFLNGDGALAGSTGVVKTGRTVNLTGAGALSVGPSYTRTNLAAHPRPDSYTGFATGGNGAISADSSGPDGAPAALLTWTTLPTSGGASLVGSDRAPVQGGVVYAISGWIRTSQAVTTGSVEVAWFNAGGSPIGTSRPLVSTVAGVWQRVSYIGAAPANAVSVQYGVRTGVVPTTGSFVMAASQMLVERADAVGDYFDGSTPSAGAISAQWTGTVNNSISTEQLPTPVAAVSNNVDFTGSGTLSRIGGPKGIGSVALTGSGALLVGTSKANALRSVALTGSGVLTAGSIFTEAFGTAALTGIGSLATAHTIAVGGSSSLTGAGSLVVGALMTLSARVNFGGEGKMFARAKRLYHYDMFAGEVVPLAMYLGDEFIIAAYYGDSKVL